MSSGASAAPTVHRVNHAFEPVSVARSASNAASSLACPSVLLVGRNGSWGSFVLKSLEKFGCALSFEAPQNVTPLFVSERRYDVILLDSTVPPEQRRQLAAALAGSGASIYYTFPVENGCWWLPALHRGQDCHGTPAFRRNEFPAELERILWNFAAE
jgi:hypothetical protein